MSKFQRERAHLVPLSLVAVQRGQRFIVPGIEGDFRLAMPADLPAGALQIHIDGRQLLLCVGPEDQLFWLDQGSKIYVRQTAWHG